MPRYNANLEICQKLTEFFEKPENHDLRFFQGLSVLGMIENQHIDIMCIKDNFHEESLATIRNMKK